MKNPTYNISPNPERIDGYAGRIMRVDLTEGVISSEGLDVDSIRNYIGGAALGIRYIYDEILPEVKWSDPENRLFLGSGVLGGTQVRGSGSYAAIAKGPMTNGIGSSQGNGIFGAYLRLAGFDAIILQGLAPRWSYLHIHDGVAEIKEADFLIGKDNYEVDRLIRERLKKERKISILSIGPAGENLVRFACLFNDIGHVAAHNGCGAVMGSKRLKAIVIEKSDNHMPLKDGAKLKKIAKQIYDRTMDIFPVFLEEGTIGGVLLGAKMGMAPVKNYTINDYNILPKKLDTYSTHNIMKKFNAKRKSVPCWLCSAKHCHMLEINEGKYAGTTFEEPDGEGVSLFSSTVDIEDVTTTMKINYDIDCLGMDVNESGWVIAWTIECYEKGILTNKDTDGLEMTWGNGEAILAMLKKIANRDGFGNILAEGVMRAARQVGGESVDFAVHTMKGNTPRGHDHRAKWIELFDTCVSNLGTLETHSMAPFNLLGMSPKYDGFDPETVSTVEANIKGAMVFEDSLVTCRFNTLTQLDLLCEAINAVTGWDMDIPESMSVGLRAVNLARAFNLLNGIGVELDAPSKRYGSTLTDGMHKGHGIMPHWDKMLKNYYGLMGWDEKTGKPLPETLKNLGLDFVIPKLWP